MERKNRTVLQVYCRGWFMPPFFAVFVCRIRRRGCDCQATGRACRRRSVSRGEHCTWSERKYPGPGRSAHNRFQAYSRTFSNRTYSYGDRRAGRPCGRPRRSAEAARERQCPGTFCNDGAVVGNGVRKASCERAGTRWVVA